jgi:hypothetical protein
MTKSKESDLLGLLPARTGGLAPTGLGGGALTKAEQRIAAETRKQRLAMRCQAAKTADGLHHIGDMHEAGSDQFYTTMIHHEVVNNLAQGSAMEPYIAEYNKRGAQQLARHLTGAVEIGARNTAEIIAESCIGADEPEPGFWGRVLGRT